MSLVNQPRPLFRPSAGVAVWVIAVVVVAVLLLVVAAAVVALIVWKRCAQCEIQSVQGAWRTHSWSTLMRQMPVQNFVSTFAFFQEKIPAKRIFTKRSHLPWFGPNDEFLGLLRRVSGLRAVSLTRPIRLRRAVLAHAQQERQAAPAGAPGLGADPCVRYTGPEQLSAPRISRNHRLSNR